MEIGAYGKQSQAEVSMLNQSNFRVIARLDVKNGKLIKGIHLEGLRILGDPNEFALDYYNQGIDEIVLMDPVASLYGRNTLGEVLGAAVNDIFVPITAGGGIRNLDDARSLLRAGADKVAINTGAINRPELIREIAEEFGSQAIVLSVEAKRVGSGWIAYTDNGRESSNLPVVDWISMGIELGAGEMLVTSIDREGTRRGFDQDLIALIDPIATVPFIVSGGMGKLADLKPLSTFANVDAVAIASVIHYQIERVSAIKDYSRNLGFHGRHQAH